MRQEAIASSLLRRVSRPANLLMVGLVGALFGLFWLLSRDPEPRWETLEFLLPFILLFGHLALDPVPWQWTGGTEGRAGMGRGFLQALVFDLAWVALVLAAVHLVGWHQGPHLPPPGESLAPGPLPPGFHLQPGFGPERLSHHRAPRPIWVVGLVNVAFGLAFGWVVAEKEATEVRERRTAALLRRSRARALQNQLDPHVLYNALNGLSELVHEDPLAAEEVVVRLADLYRMLTVQGTKMIVTLAEERDLVEAYLAMEQMRLGDRLRVRWQWPDWADTLRLPPYFLLPLVENAIKHGISPAEKGGELDIACLRGPAGVVQLVVENTGRPLQDGGRGVGLGNLEARLGLWTEISGAFSLETRGDRTVATVQWIPEGSR